MAVFGTSFFVTHSPEGTSFADDVVRWLREAGHNAVKQADPGLPAFWGSQRIAVGYASTRGYNVIACLDEPDVVQYAIDQRALESLGVDHFPVVEPTGMTIIDLGRFVYFDQIGLGEAAVLSVPSDRAVESGIRSPIVSAVQQRVDGLRQQNKTASLSLAAYVEGLDTITAAPFRQDQILATIGDAFTKRRHELSRSGTANPRKDLRLIANSANELDLVECAVTGEISRFPREIVADSDLRSRMLATTFSDIPRRMSFVDHFKQYLFEGIKPSGSRMILEHRQLNVRNDLILMGVPALLRRDDVRAERFTLDELAAAGAAAFYEQLVNDITLSVPRSKNRDLVRDEWEMVSASIPRRALFSILADTVAVVDVELSRRMSVDMTDVEDRMDGRAADESARSRDAYARRHETGTFSTPREMFALNRYRTPDPSVGDPLDASRWAWPMTTGGDSGHGDTRTYSNLRESFLESHQRDTQADVGDADAHHEFFT